MSDTWNHEADAWDSLNDDDDDEAEWGGRQPRAPVTCRRCGARGLTWLMKDGAWRLFSDAGMHACATPRNPFGPVL